MLESFFAYLLIMRYTQTSLKKRTRIFLVCVFCIIAALSGRLVYIQIFNGAHLQLLAAEQWYRDLPLGAKRGNIIDTNGVVMTQSTLTYSVYVRPVAVTNPERVAEVLASRLALNYQTLLTKVKSRGASEWLIKMQVEKETAVKIVAENLDGVFISQTYRRDYPLGTVGGQILGLVSIDNIGQEGLEAYYNAVLRGTDGKAAQPSDLRGVPRQGVEYYVPATDGLDLVLNVDSVIQGILQTTINRAYNDQGAKNVSALMLDIATGAVIASASAPFYDMGTQPRNNVSELLTLIKNSPIINVLEPGSTFKIITLAAAIEEGLVSESDRFNCPGFRMIGGERVKCWRTRGHGTQTLAEGVQNSCNCVFMDLAARLGVDKYYEYLNKFGLGKKTGVDFYGEPSGLILDKKWVRPVDLARISFGQAIAVSPIQFLTTISAIIGDGTLKTPRFAKSVPAANTTVTGPNRGKTVSAQTSAHIRELLFGVVTNGSGKYAAVPGYHIGGKTGTAQKYKDGIIDQGHYISSFVGFLSVNNRAKYSVLLLVDEPSKNGYYGSIVAAPYVGQIFSDVIKYLKIPAETPITQMSALITLKPVAGLPIAEAVARLTAQGFFVDVAGEGDTATGTFPAAGSELKSGEPVVIFTNSPD